MTLPSDQPPGEAHSKVGWGTARGSEVVYEKLPTDHDLTVGAAATALEALGYNADQAPVLVTSGREMSWLSGRWADWQHAVSIALHFGMRVRIDASMTDAEEWYIEWHGRRVGSPGA